MSFCNSDNEATIEVSEMPEPNVDKEMQALRKELERLFELSPSLSPSLYLVAKPLRSSQSPTAKHSLPEEALLNNLLSKEFGEQQAAKLLQVPAFRRRLEEAKNSLFSVAWQPRLRKPKLFVVPKPPSA